MARNPNRSTLMITAITTNLARVNVQLQQPINPASAPASLSSRHIWSSSYGKVITSLILWAYTSQTTRGSSPLSMQQHTHNCPLRGPPIHYTGNYTLPVLPTIPAVVFCTTPPSITPAVFLCPSFSFHSIYWFSRPRVLGQHHTSAPNMKYTFIHVCSDRYYPESSSNWLLLLRTLAPHLKGQPPAFDRRRYSKAKSFIWLPTWWKHKRSDQITTKSKLLSTMRVTHE